MHVKELDVSLTLHFGEGCMCVTANILQSLHFEVTQTYSPSDHLVCLELSTSILLDLMSVYYTAKWEMVSHELVSEDLSLKSAIYINSTGSTRAEDWKDRHGMCPGDSEIKGSCRETMWGNDSDWCAELTWHLTRLSCWVCNCNKCCSLYTNSCAGSWWNWNSQGDN